MSSVALDQLARWLGRFGVSGAHGETVAELFTSAGMSAVNDSGPAYGTFFLRFGMTAGDTTTLTPAELGDALRGGLEGVIARGESDLADELARAVDAYTAAVSEGADAAAAASTAGSLPLFTTLAAELA